MRQVYLDYAATTPVHPEVQRVMGKYFNEVYGNPASLHAMGQEAYGAVEDVRATIADVLGSQSEEVLFTSGGTESDNCAVKGVAFALREKGNHIITSSIEHHAVLEACYFLQKNGFDITILPVDRYGIVDPDDVRKAITRSTILVSIMHANNEIGTIEPVEEIGTLCRERKVYFHTDAVQSFGSLNTRVDDLNVDLLSLSAHKFYGPKGVGVLYVRKGTRFVPLLHGGSQEFGKRASTLNVPGIMGLGKAVMLARDEQTSRVGHGMKLRDRLIHFITQSIEDTQLNGHPKQRLPNNCHVTIKNIEGESMLLKLDAVGIEVATGSACSSESLEPSHVLIATGISPVDAHGSLRFTVGRLTTEDDIAYVEQHLPRIIEELRIVSPFTKK
ncbi:cysteine desulfurase [candidate division WOR-3 bacterium]|nr:cysteine desulfurase [candidate division WOR-3 bacterium]